MAICSLFFALSASARCISVLCVSWSSLLRRVHLFGRYHFCVAALGTALKMLPPGASTCLQADRGTEPSGVGGHLGSPGTVRLGVQGGGCFRPWPCAGAQRGLPAEPLGVLVDLRCVKLHACYKQFGFLMQGKPLKNKQKTQTRNKPKKPTTQINKTKNSNNKTNQIINTPTKKQPHKKPSWSWGGSVPSDSCSEWFWPALVLIVNVSQTLKQNKMKIYTHTPSVVILIF